MYVQPFYQQLMIKNVLIACGVLLLFSCDRCNDFDNGDVNNAGSIVFDINLSRCYGSAVARQQGGGLVMRSRSEFLNFFPKRTAACAIGDSLELDFDQYMLLAYPTEGTCNTSIARRVDIQPNGLRAIYSIELENCGRCGVQNFNNNLVAIDRLPPEYSIEFEFIEN
jgi:hypothetical protein